MSEANGLMCAIITGMAFGWYLSFVTSASWKTLYLDGLKDRDRLSERLQETEELVDRLIPGEAKR